MSWLGSTLKTLDTRKELVNNIGGNTQPSRAVVTNNGGEIDSSVVTVAELALLSGISSNVQTQLTDLGNDKEDEITGAATSVTSANLTSDRVLLSDGAGKIIASSVTATTLAYLDPASSIQGQINSKQSEITTSAPLSQSKVQGLADTLSGKQPAIGSTTNLVVNKVTFGSGGSAIDFQGVVPTNSTLVLSRGTLTLIDSASGTVAADISGINTDTNTTNSTLVLSSGTLTLTDSASGTVAADISGINTDTNTTNSTLVLSSGTLTLTDSASGTVAADISGINTDTNTTNSTLVLSSGTLTLTDSASGTVAVDLPSTTTSVTSGSNDAVSSGAVYTALSGYLPIDANGNVGVGTANPATPLTIDAAGAIGGSYKSHLLIMDQTAYNQTGNGGGILFGGLTSSTAIGYWAKVSGEKANLTENDASGVLRFWTRSGSSYPQERMIIDNDGNVGIAETAPSEKLQVDGKIKCEDIKYPITDAGGNESDQSLVSLHSTVSSLSTSLSSYALNSALSDYVLSSQFPQADDATLGGVKIDGGNLSINNSTGILSATITVSQSVAHVGVFTLQATTDFITATETFLRWKPDLSATDSSSQGLVHTATNNIPQGSLFPCNDTSGVYNINVQLSLTEGTNQGRSFHVAEVRLYTNSISTTGRGDLVRTYFLGGGYARMLSGTNKTFYGGNIQLTMNQNDQFEVISSRKYVSNTNSLELNDGSEATRLIIDRVIIS